MSNIRGKTVPLTAHRRGVTELMHFAKHVPTATLDRRMALAPLVEARNQCPDRPGWAALFIKAFALVARNHPFLRRSYLSFPHARFYEHGESVAAFTVARDLEGEEIVVVGHCVEADDKPLAEIDAGIRAMKDRPLQEIAGYRRLKRLARWPWPIRRFVWWLGLSVLGRAKSRQFGTYAVTSTAALGTGVLKVQTVLTSTLHYGLLEPDGSMEMRLTFDHRVYDGADAARVLVELEKILLTDIVTELQTARHTGDIPYHESTPYVLKGDAACFRPGP